MGRPSKNPVVKAPVKNVARQPRGRSQPCGYIYILVNPSFPDYVKIGYATDVEARLKQLNRSECIPFAFRVYATYEVYQPLQDKDVHSLIDSINPNLRAVDNFNGKSRVREFFAMTPEDAFNILKSIASLSGMTGGLKLAFEVSDSSDDSELQGQKKRSMFSFAKCGISVGEEINFVGHPEIVATVISETKVAYWGVTYSLSSLTQKIMELSYQVQGPKFWEYKGKVLTKLREGRETAGLYK